MLRGLQYQLIEKDQIRSSNKLSQIEQDKKNIQYQKKKETQRQKQSLRSRKFTQDMKIYDIYNRIDAQKRMKQQQFSKIIIQNPAHIKNISQEERIKKQMQNRLKKTIEIKQSLLEQIQKHNSQKYSKKDEVNLSLYNPLDKIFNQKQKRLNYDKQEYFNFLRQQQEEHKRKIIAQKYMNEQEYKLNLSHLNKVIGQESRRKSSTDRSLMHIGNPEQLSQRKDQLYFNQLRNMTPNTPNSVRNRSFDRKQQNRIEMTPKEQSDDIRIVRNKIQKLKSYNIFTPN